MRKLSMEELNRKSVGEFRQAEKTPLVLVLDSVRSLHNVGSVFRTADAFLLQCIYLCGFTGTPPHRDIHKTALGATDTVDWKYFPTVTEALNDLKKEGYAIWAVEQVKGGTPLQDFSTQASPLAMVFGNEVSGVSTEALALADGCIEIPQLGMKHSLNIAVSVGIVVWDLFCKMTVQACK
ncbi:MAG TPA: RNA methyltransferase [Chitinophagaceae bacterium]|nr:RNA methyltransferase [Chitinophagaceae bacterium]